MGPSFVQLWGEWDFPLLSAFCILTEILSILFIRLHVQFLTCIISDFHTWCSTTKLYVARIG